MAAGVQACGHNSTGLPAAVSRPPRLRAPDCGAAATLRCATTRPQHTHGARLNHLDGERLSQADAASPSGLEESLHFGVPTMFQALPSQRAQYHDGALGRTREHPTPLMPPRLPSAATPPASYHPESFLDFSRADQHSSPCGASKVSNPNSPCSGPRSHNASAAHFDAAWLAPYGHPHSAAAHHRQHAKVPRTTLRELYRHSAAHHAQQSARRGQLREYEMSAMEAFDIALETDLRPRMSTDAVPCAQEARSQHAGGAHYHQVSGRAQGMLRSTTCAGPVRPMAQKPPVYSKPILTQQPLRQAAQRVPGPRTTWRPRSQPYLFDSMLQQVEQLHACDGELYQQRGVRRKDAPIDGCNRGVAAQPAKRARRPAAAAAPCTVYAQGGLPVPQGAARPGVQGLGYQSMARTPQAAPQPVPRGCRTWEVMHDIASVPDGQWHHEFLNDLAGLLGHEAMPVARPAPPELDAQSCVGGGGAVCGGDVCAPQPLMRWHALPGWQQSSLYEHSTHSMGMCEGAGEN